MAHIMSLIPRPKRHNEPSRKPLNVNQQETKREKKEHLDKNAKLIPVFKFVGSKQADERR
jgi:hypothetical protein